MAGWRLQARSFGDPHIYFSVTVDELCLNGCDPNHYMMNHRQRSLGLWSPLGCLFVAVLTPWVVAQENRTTVHLEYKLQVNFTNSIPTIESAVFAVENATEVLLLNLLSKNLGASSSNPASEIFFQSSLGDACWDSSVPSDACYAVTTVASILVPPNINPALVVLATTNEQVQAAWINDIEQIFPNVLRVSALPTTPTMSDAVDATVSVRLQHVVADRIMNDYEIGIFESTMLSLLLDAAKNYNLTYLSLHSVVVLSQTLVPSSSTRQRDLQQSSSVDNIVNASISGDCTGCTSNQFSNLIDDTVNSPNFHKNLQKNGQGSGSGNTTNYFNSVSNTTVSVSALSGSGFTTNNNGEGSSASAATSGSTFSKSSAPHALWVILAACVGLVVAVVLVLVVLAGRRRRRRAAAEGEEVEAANDEEGRRDTRRGRRRSNSFHKPSDVTDEDDAY